MPDRIKQYIVILLSIVLGIFLAKLTPIPTAKSKQANEDAPSPYTTSHEQNRALETPQLAQKPQNILDAEYQGNREYLLFTVSPKNEDLRIFNQACDGKVHTFESIALQAKRENRMLFLAMNAGMFEKDGTAKGLLVDKGISFRQLDTLKKGFGNFYLQPNGVLAIDENKRAYVIPTDQYDSLTQHTKIKYATQSGPMMLINGQINSLLKKGSKNLHIRNAVGINEMGQLVFIISKEKTNFYDLASILLKKGCNHALYLDGFVSKVYYPSMQLGSLQDGNALGPILAVFREEII